MVFSPFRQAVWDGGQHAVNAYEMLDTGSGFFKINETRRKSAFIPYLENLHHLNVLFLQRAVSLP